MDNRKQIIIGLRWADVYELMKGIDQPPSILPLENKYQNFTKRLEKMFANEFPNKTIEIDWLD